MLEQLRETWDSLDSRRRAALVALAVVLVGGLIAVTVWAARPSWAVLYGDLSPRDAQAVVEALREQGVRYRLVAGGATIEVPRERLYELRLDLAGEGLPAASTVGFELFDRTSFSSSDLQNNVNLQRALQGELERSICTLAEISSARVHLAVPEERLFSDQQEAPSASVVVGLDSGRLATAQVAAIAQLVASAVPALVPAAVTVVDTAGRVLSGGWDSAGGLQTMAQMEATRAFEDGLRAHLQSMLDSVLGAHKSVVRVQAELDFQSQELTRETLQPPDGQGVLRREELTQEQYEGSGGPEVGGPAGLTAIGSRTSPGSGGSYEHRHESREYDYSRQHEQVTSPPGQVRRLAVAVVIDEGLSSSVARQVQNLVEAAAGIDSERGDRVTVETMAIEAIKVAEEQTKLAESAQAERQRQQSMGRAVRYGSIIVMLAMIAAASLMLMRTLRPAQRPEGKTRAMPDEPDEEREPETPAEGTGETPEISPVSVEELQASAGLGAAPDEPLVTRLSEMGAQAPADFARQLRDWVSSAEPEGGAEDGES